LLVSTSIAAKPYVEPGRQLRESPRIVQSDAPLLRRQSDEPVQSTTIE
jgi:hypothetical protein